MAKEEKKVVRLEQADALEDGGKGVGVKKDKKLTALGNDWLDENEKRGAATTALRELDTKIQDRMAVIGLEVYRFGDKEVYLKKGKTHARVKSVKVDGGESEESDLVED